MLYAPLATRADLQGELLPKPVELLLKPKERLANLQLK